MGILKFGSMRPWICTLIIFLGGCTRESFWAQSEYIRPSDLASHKIRTPDPRRQCPDVGQRIVVYWNLPQQFRDYEDLWLILAMRFGNLEERVIREPIECSRNYFIYQLFNDEFFDKKGIQGFKAEIVSDGTVLKEWVHQIWADVIDIGICESNPWDDCDCLEDQEASP